MSSTVEHDADFNPYEETQRLTPNQNKDSFDTRTPPAASASSKSVLTPILLYSIPTIVLSATVPVVLLLYLFGIHQWERDGTAFKSSADLQNVLTISQVETNIISYTLPLLVLVIAYRVAAEWLQACNTGDARNRPSPMQ